MKRGIMCWHAKSTSYSFAAYSRITVYTIFQRQIQIYTTHAVWRCQPVKQAAYPAERLEHSFFLEISYAIPSLETVYRGWQNNHWDKILQSTNRGAIAKIVARRLIDKSLQSSKWRRLVKSPQSLYDTNCNIKHQTVSKIANWNRKLPMSNQMCSFYERNVVLSHTNRCTLLDGQLPSPFHDIDK